MENEPISGLKGLVEAGLELFYPAVCQICGEERATPKEGFVGAICRENVHFITPPFCTRCGLPPMGEVTNDFVCANCRDIEFYFSSARAAVLADSFMLDIIHRYKYQHHLYFEPFLAELLLKQALPALGDSNWDMVVPVPLHPTKEREREFNQAERLGAHLARALGIPVNKRIIQRVVSTQTQTRLTRKERAKNMESAFAPFPGIRIDGLRVLLVDDVMTTGATTNGCAKVLHEIGAAEIRVWTVARGL